MVNGFRALDQHSVHDNDIIIRVRPFLWPRAPNLPGLDENFL